MVHYARTELFCPTYICPFKFSSDGAGWFNFDADAGREEDQNVYLAALAKDFNMTLGANLEETRGGGGPVSKLGEIRQHLSQTIPDHPMLKIRYILHSPH